LSWHVTLSQKHLPIIVIVHQLAIQLGRHIPHPRRALPAPEHWDGVPAPMA
jgi:hypothetical protein